MEFYTGADMAREALDPYEAMEAVVRHRLHVDLASASVSVWYRDASNNRLRSVDRDLGADAMQAVCAAITQAVELAEPDDDDEICPACNGSGEGMYDGTRCRSCGGSGTERTERDEPDWDALRKERAELAHLNGDE